VTVEISHVLAQIAVELARDAGSAEASRFADIIAYVPSASGKKETDESVETLLEYFYQPLLRCCAPPKLPGPVSSQGWFCSR
jgi:hypothetical protein